MRSNTQMRPNQQRILGLLARDDGLSRAALARRLALPKATVTDLVNDLIARGIVVETDGRPASVRGSAGRPARTLALTGPPPAIGIAVWSTGLLRVAIATLSGRILTDDLTVLDPVRRAARCWSRRSTWSSAAADAAGYDVERAGRGRAGRTGAVPAWRRACRYGGRRTGRPACSRAGCTTIRRATLERTSRDAGAGRERRESRRARRVRVRRRPRPQQPDLRQARRAQRRRRPDRQRLAAPRRRAASPANSRTSRSTTDGPLCAAAAAAA